MTDLTNKPRPWGFLLLFISIPTLICCALPIILIRLGFGATVASLYSEQLPFLQWFGINSVLIFIISGGILSVSGLTLLKSKQTCPADPVLANACKKARKWNVVFWFASSFLWTLGAFTAFGLPLLI